MLGRSGLFSTLMIGTTTPCSAQSLRSYKRFRVPLSVSPFTESVLRTGIAFKDGGSTAQTTEEMQRMCVSGWHVFYSFRQRPMDRAQAKGQPDKEAQRRLPGCLQPTRAQTDARGGDSNLIRDK